MLKTLAIANYRSLRDFRLALGPLNLITGANGCGKSSVYRSFQLLASAGRGGIIPGLAREGGIESTLWAGSEQGALRQLRKGQAVQGTLRSEPKSLRLGFATEDFGYQIDLGHPPSSPPLNSPFDLDPAIKCEAIWHGPTLRPSSLLAERRGPLLRSRDAVGAWSIVHQDLPPYESLFDALSDPRSAPELFLLRERLRNWRFYDHFRSDAEAPARRAQIGTRSFVLDHDGANLAATLQTIRELGQPGLLERAVADAFPGAELEIDFSGGRFEVQMRQLGLLRPLAASELSDGTLRYLLLCAALLSIRAPELLVLNEPENSLHPDLLPALGRLIRQASERTQVLVVSHSLPLIEALNRDPRCQHYRLEKDGGETQIAGQDLLSKPAWQWMQR